MGTHCVFASSVECAQIKSRLDCIDRCPRDEQTEKAKECPLLLTATWTNQSRICSSRSERQLDVSRVCRLILSCSLTRLNSLIKLSKFNKTICRIIDKSTIDSTCLEDDGERRSRWIDPDTATLKNIDSCLLRVCLPFLKLCFLRWAYRIYRLWKETWLRRRTFQIIEPSIGSRSRTREKSQASIADDILEP